MSAPQAAALLDLGYRLVLLKPATKEPDGGFGWIDRPVTTAAEVGRLHGRNVGVLGGSPVGGGRLLVLDIDAKSGAGGFESVRRLEATYGPLPLTAAVTTPGGGRHLYYQVPPDVPLSGVRELLKKLGYPGLDLIGDGLYAVAPPSALAGGSYRWERHPGEGLSEAPLWLQHLLRVGGRPRPPAGYGRPRKGHGGRAGGRWVRTGVLGPAEEVIERFPVTGPGQRQDQMVPAVLSMFRKGLRPEQVREAMVRWHEHHANVFTTPWADALRLLDDCIAGTICNVETGKVSLVGTDHLAAQAGQELTPWQATFLRGLPSLPPLSPVPLPSLTVREGKTRKQPRGRTSPHRSGNWPKSC